MSPADFVAPAPSGLPHREQPVAVYPVFLTGLAGMLCVVIGGGTVATRKVHGMLAAQARVRIISPTLTPELDALYRAARVEWIPRGYATTTVGGDLAGANLVFAATNAREINQAVARAARQRGILCNVADAPAEGTFHVPAVYRGSCPGEGPGEDSQVVIAVGTGGQSPGLARRLRDALAAALHEFGKTREHSR